MAKTFEFDRFDQVGNADAEGEFVLAQDAINREKVNADRIRVLEVQLKEAREAAGILDALLTRAWGVDVKWNKEPNTIRRIVLDIRDTTTAGQHHVDHAKALIAEFCKTAPPTT